MDAFASHHQLDPRVHRRVGHRRPVDNRPVAQAPGALLAPADGASGRFEEGYLMGFLEDILKALDRIPIWKRLQELPSEVDGLKQRIAALEAALARCPADGCPYCGARAFRLKQQDMNGEREVWECSECQKRAELRLDLLSPSAMKSSRIWRDRK